MFSAKQALSQMVLPTEDFTPDQRDRWAEYLRVHLAKNKWTREIAGDEDWNKLFNGFINAMTRPRMGMILTGVCGCGKTSFVDATDICTKRINCILPEEVEWLDYSNNPDFVNRLLNCNVLIDDLGAENRQNQFGVVREIVSDFLCRYELRGKGRVFVTTNYNGKELMARYGDRLIRRLKSLCCPVKFTGEDKTNWLT